MVNVLDCDYKVNELELWSRYYIHFPSNILRKGTNPFITPVLCFLVSQLLFSSKMALALNNPQKWISYKSKKPS